MRKLFKKPVLIAALCFMVVWAITAGVAYGATIFTRSMNVSVNVVGEAGFAFYSNQAATQLITEVSLPDIEPGENSSFTIYLKNTSSVTETISAGTNTVSASIGVLTLRFDGQSQRTIAPGAVCRVDGTLAVSEDAAAGPLNFTFTVNAVPVTGTTTTSPTTTVALNGQQIFAASCATCHASGPPNTNRTQSQLVSFIPTHRTGSSLTSAQVAAVAAYIKP